MILSNSVEGYHESSDLWQVMWPEFRGREVHSDLFGKRERMRPLHELVQFGGRIPRVVGFVAGMVARIQGKRTA
jgi:hypothetical protein